MKYCSKRFLDAGDSSVTSSCVAFHGKAVYGSTKTPDTVTFFEIASCSEKIHLHKAQHEPMSAFVARLKVLKVAIQLFIEFLEDTQCPPVTSQRRKNNVVV